MKRVVVLAALLGLAPRSTRAADVVPPAATRPAAITLHLKDAPAKTAIDQFARQVGAPLPVVPSDLLDKPSLPPVTLDLDRQPFWVALEALSRKAGLDPIVSADDPYPRFQLGQGAGGFWEEPHAVAGPVILFANTVERTNSVELRRSKDHQFDRTLTVELTAFAEPGLRVLWAAPDVRILAATDDRGRSLHAAPDLPPDEQIEESQGNGLYTWNLAVALDAPPTDPPKRIVTLKGRTRVRIQTSGERVEIDDVMKSRAVSRVVAGVPFTFKSLKKADIEYILQVSLRRDKKAPPAWHDLRQSVYNGHMALYDNQGRLVAGRATENGGEYNNDKIDATLRFVREAGISDPQAGDPFKLVWVAPTSSTELPVDFEFHDLPVPE